MTYPRILALNWLALALTLVASCQAMPAHAGALYLDIGAGGSFFQRTVEDGTWCQQATGSGCTFNLKDFAWRAAVGYDFSPEWGLQFTVSSLGTPRLFSQFVDDSEYDPHRHACTGPTCANPHQLWTHDDMRAYDVRVIRTFPSGNWKPRLFIGPALLTHRLTVNSQHNDGSVKVAHQHYGRIPALVLGAGLCYGERWQLCGDAAYFLGIGGSNGFSGYQYEWPIAKDVPTFTASLKYTFGG